MNAHVLVVDDEDSVLRVCRKLLEKSGFSPLTAADSTTALRTLESLPPDVVMMDIKLSKSDVMNGIDCVAAMRANGFNGIVCMMTSDGSPNCVIESALAGADSYFVKGRSGNLALEVESLIRMRENVESKQGALDSFPDVVFLKSLGLDKTQIDLLWKMHTGSYPEIKELAFEMGMEPDTLSKKLERIRKKLGLKNNGQLAQLMTSLSVFTYRRRCSTKY